MLLECDRDYSFVVESACLSRNGDGDRETCELMFTTADCFVDGFHAKKN